MKAPADAGAFIVAVKNLILNIHNESKERKIPIGLAQQSLAIAMTSEYARASQLMLE
ncbi:hypothetical protein HCU74_14820 [Spongiibacter sp. KMU-166]|uniref:Uncharacterized protein n=1 Tax=Spongiibacter thalassae TaxID=2721624 RepID=A0ABX1GJN5_9GAMM|nr:hypothetical protein [Spongiibacter thalassae]NKI18683.1 hypothetical protein [Spongiibacter thalassae]